MTLITPHQHHLLESAPLAALLKAEQLPNRQNLKNLLNTALTRLSSSEKKLETAELKIKKLESQIQTLEHLATCDSLTGLTNRRGFEIAFEQEMDRLNRGLSHGGVLVIIDMDNFKTINDTFGHLAGDSCLRLIGQTLANEIRTMDTAARLGGDEFVVLMVGANRDDILNRIQYLAQQLNGLSLIWQGHEIPLHASIGLKDFAKGDRAQDIFEAADHALYTNKKQRKMKVDQTVSPDGRLS